MSRAPCQKGNGDHQLSESSKFCLLISTVDAPRSVATASRSSEQIVHETRVSGSSRPAEGRSRVEAESRIHASSSFQLLSRWFLLQSLDCKPTKEKAGVLMRIDTTGSRLGSRCPPLRKALTNATSAGIGTRLSSGSVTFNTSAVQGR